MPETFRPVSKHLKEAREKTADAPEARHLLTVQEQIDAIGGGDFEALQNQQPEVATSSCRGMCSC